jgi:predicted secreted protein
VKEEARTSQREKYPGRKKMKSLIVFGLIYILLLPLLALGCDKSSPTTIPTTVPPATTNSADIKTIDISISDFSTTSNITKNIELAKGGSLIVRLGSNQSTGYQWGEADINNTNVITQVNHTYDAPQNTEVVGAAGQEVWEFDAGNSGAAVIRMDYSREWEGGEKATYVMTINVTVK